MKMKKIKLLTLMLSLVNALQAQNVTIGSGTASQKLEVKGNTLITDSVGVGVVNPSFKLDIGGRMRLRSKGDGNIFETAGTWFNDMNNTDAPAFLGMLSDTAVGIYASGLGNWSLQMNTNTAFVGIGSSVFTPKQNLHVVGNTYINNNLSIGPLTNTPATNRLDVNGTLKVTGTINVGNKVETVNLVTSKTEVNGMLRGANITVNNNVKVSGNIHMGLTQIVQFDNQRENSEQTKICGCPIGMKVLGGGGGGTVFLTAQPKVSVLFTGPTDDGNGWKVILKTTVGDYNETMPIKYFAICAKMRQ
jgi:hypothetical protein